MPLDSDINNADAQLHVEFYTRDEGPNAGKTYVRIMAPGDKTNILDQPLRDDHKERFPRQWLYYQMQQSEGAAAQIGTPLSQWNKDAPDEINRDQIAELNSWPSPRTRSCSAWAWVALACATVRVCI
jgi:hypothetical protein